MQQRDLPLFPLNTVLFPGSAIPLHIFEERYKLMMAHCLEGDRSFGVVLIKSGSEVGEPAEPYTIGTVAKISDVNTLEDGRMFISVLGGARFRILEVLAKEPYLLGRVELLSEAEDLDKPAPNLVKVVQEALDGYVRAAMGLRGGWIRHFTVLPDAWALSYYIADTFIGDLLLKQKLLETPTAEERLRLEVEALSQETQKLQKELQKKGIGRFGAN